MLDVRYEDVTKIWNRNPPPPNKPGGGGAKCPSWLPYSTDSYLHILVFVFVSCVSQFAKFCKLWARQRRQVFLCVTICKILQIVDQTTTTRFSFFEALLVNQMSE